MVMKKRIESRVLERERVGVCVSFLLVGKESEEEREREKDRWALILCGIGGVDDDDDGDGCRTAKANMCVCVCVCAEKNKRRVLTSCANFLVIVGCLSSIKTKTG